jgi:hypothetical protein
MERAPRTSGFHAKENPAPTMRPIIAERAERTDHADLVEQLRLLRQHAMILGGISVFWFIIAAFHGAYLSDVTIQAVAVNAYIPDTLQALGHAPGWWFAIPGGIDAFVALAVVQMSHGRLLSFDLVERFAIEGWLRALQLLTFALALVYACGALAILYYISLSPYGL